MMDPKNSIGIRSIFMSHRINICFILLLLLLCTYSQFIIVSGYTATTITSITATNRQNRRRNERSQSSQPFLSEHQCHNNNNIIKYNIDLEQNIDLISDDNTSIRYDQYQRREEQVSSKMNRRATLKVFLAGVLSSNVLIDMSHHQQHAVAITDETATTTTLSMQKDIHEAFQIVRNEISDSINGGIPILQTYLNQREYSNILEFTKLYDQILRKEKIGRAKKLFLNYVKEIEEEGKDNVNMNLKKKYGERITTISNAITFDLIGMNRSARKQPSLSSSSSSIESNATDGFNKNIDEEIQKYLNLLQSDVEQFLQLEQEIP